MEWPIMAWHFTESLQGQKHFVRCIQGSYTLLKENHLLSVKTLVSVLVNWPIVTWELFQGHFLHSSSLFLRHKIEITIVELIHLIFSSMHAKHPHLYFVFCILFSFSPLQLSLCHDIHTHMHSNTHTHTQHKKSRPQLRQAISLTIQSVFFPMMFPIGTGRRKSDLLPHRTHAVALIWKMISVLLEPINIILVSPVNDTFLPSIVDLTEEEMSVRGFEEAKRRKRGRGRNPPGPYI